MKKEKGRAKNVNIDDKHYHVDLRCALKRIVVLTYMGIIVSSVASLPGIVTDKFDRAIARFRPRFFCNIQL
ncbi:MAG: hypothetical protein JW915_10735 [Chitinispirillaceae bacterium]|nr:hypothetical protein [Chitinispirillaceae bacterium]